MNPAVLDWNWRYVALVYTEMNTEVALAACVYACVRDTYVHIPRSSAS